MDPQSPANTVSDALLEVEDTLLCVDMVRDIAHDLVRMSKARQTMLARPVPTRRNRVKILARELAEEYERELGVSAQALIGHASKMEHAGAQLRAAVQTQPAAAGIQEINARQAVVSALLDEWDSLFKPYWEKLRELEARPGSPVRLHSWSQHGTNDWLQPDRIYLDVTDATLEQVKAIWPHVQLGQEDLAAEGLSQKRRRGERGPDAQTRYWLQQIVEQGYQAAWQAYHRAWDQDPTLDKPPWFEMAERWKKRIKPRVPEDRLI